MNIEQAKIKIQELIKNITKHNHAYYVDNNPTITDAAFDHIYQQLVNIEKQFPSLIELSSPTQRVGGKANSSFFSSYP